MRLTPSYSLVGNRTRGYPAFIVYLKYPVIASKLSNTNIDLYYYSTALTGSRCIAVYFVSY